MAWPGWSEGDWGIREREEGGRGRGRWEEKGDGLSPGHGRDDDGGRKSGIHPSAPSLPCPLRRQTGMALGETGGQEAGRHEACRQINKWGQGAFGQRQKGRQGGRQAPPP